MTPTPEQARAELERRAENRRRKTAGEEKIPEANQELVNATKKELKEWAK